MLWYVVQVSSCEGKRHCRETDGHGVPDAGTGGETVRSGSGAAWGTKEYVLFPGYVFLQMDYNAGNYYRLKAVPGIVKLLSRNPDPTGRDWIWLLAGQGGIPLEPTLARRQRGPGDWKQASWAEL
ncbi:MAG: transcription termination/antitermination NusG family protein [Enterocloster bolteae]